MFSPIFTKSQNILKVISEVNTWGEFRLICNLPIEFPPIFINCKRSFVHYNSCTPPKCWSSLQNLSLIWKLFLILSVMQYQNGILHFDKCNTTCRHYVPCYLHHTAYYILYKEDLGVKNRYFLESKVLELLSLLKINDN